MICAHRQVGAVVDQVHKANKWSDASPVSYRWSIVASYRLSHRNAVRLAANRAIARAAGGL